jgi:hypothetical protein
MKRGTFLYLTLVTLVALLQMNKAWAMTLPEILKECETGLTAENCKELFSSNGYSAYLSPKVDGAVDTIVDHVFYTQVQMYVDYRGYVLGAPPLFDGMVTYPLEWRGEPNRNGGSRRVGPWNCTGKTDVQCCGMIEREVYDADSNGEHLGCVAVEAYQKDLNTGEFFGVYLNPVDNTIHRLTNATKIAQIDAQEEMARQELITLIDEALVSTSFPRVSLGKMHATFVHTMRGVPKARAYPKHTKAAIRRMRFKGMTELDVTTDTELQYWLPLMKKVVQAVSSGGGLHALSNSYQGYVVHQSTSGGPGMEILTNDLTRLVIELVTCINANVGDLSSCADALDGVEVLTILPKNDAEMLSIDYQGFVLLSPPLYDGKVYYMFGSLGKPKEAVI